MRAYVRSTASAAATCRRSLGSESTLISFAHAHVMQPKILIAPEARRPRPRARSAAAPTFMSGSIRLQVTAFRASAAERASHAICRTARRAAARRSKTLQCCACIKKQSR
jgi:hypothetical protein